MPDKIKQQYHIVEILKESENKNVFLLEDSDGNRTVLKQYHKEYEQFSKNEYEILRTLQKTSNPCFPKPVDYFVQDEYAYILREYVEGDSLLNLYENGRLESEEKVLRLSIMMCRVLSILHEQKPLMIHRDVKPEAYGYCQCDVRSDVFGLGKTILFLCCGRADDLFYNCKKLSRIIFAGTKIKKIGKKAFAGIAKNSIIAVPENKKKAYMKLLKKGGYKKSVK